MTRLYQCRIRAGLTQADVAKALNVHPSAVSNWERGINPPLKKYRGQLRALYRATEEELFGKEVPDDTHT